MTLLGMYFVLQGVLEGRKNAASDTDEATKTKEITGPKYTWERGDRRAQAGEISYHTAGKTL